MTPNPDLPPALTEPLPKITPHQPLPPSLSWLGRTFGLLLLSFKRIRHRLGLTLLALLGIVLTVGLVTSAAYFSQAVDMVVLRQELKELTDITGRSAFSTRIYTLSSSRSPMTIAEAELVGQDVANTLSSEVGLPLKRQILQIQSEGFMLQPGPNSTRYAAGDSPKLLGTTNFLYIEDLADHITITEGEPYSSDRSEDILNVWMHVYQIENMGINPGEEFGVSRTLAQKPLRIRVKGFWEPIDPHSAFWFNDPNLAFREKLLISRQDYVEQIQPRSTSKTGSVAWYLTLDEQNLNPLHARQYAEGFERGMLIINQYLPKARLDRSPLDSLKEFVGRQDTLTIILLGFNIPAFGFLIYFLILTSSIIASWQRRETAILMSRGMSILGIVNLTLVEQMLLFVLGYPLGIAFGLLLAWLMGYTESFLVFTERDPLPVSLAGTNVELAIVALGVALAARLWPTIQATRQSVVMQEREFTRAIEGPFWYRYYLDLLMIIPTAYAYQQLAQEGTLALLVQDTPEDLYRDPLLILVPALFVLTGALVTMRLFPLLMRFIDIFANLLPWVSPHLALRQLARQSHHYINPLLLVIISLALGIYTFSLAASMDQWLLDRMFYKAGSDYAFTPYPNLGDDGQQAAQPLSGGSWIPIPSQFQAISGIIKATRVGNYRFESELTGRRRRRGPQFRFLAVDRADFAQVAWFREDFASDSLGGLMNRLALLPEAVLVQESLLEQLNLFVGNQISLKIRLEDGTSIPSTFTIVGSYRYFPTVYENEVAIIGNLDYLSFFYGVVPEFDLWLSLEDGVDTQEVARNIAKMNVEPILVRDARTLIIEEQAKMERVGIFGTLTIGFLAAAIMAGLGLLINTYASLRERLYRFAVLHAMGLRRRQIIAQVVMEYSLLTAYGATAGALIGAYTAQLFVPFFRITGKDQVAWPPIIPVIAEDQVFSLSAIFAMVMILSQLIVISLSIYRRLFAVISAGPQG